MTAPGFNAIQATCSILACKGRAMRFVGTGFALRDRWHVATAAHVVDPDADVDRYWVNFQHHETPAHAVALDVQRHPRADLAILTIGARMYTSDGGVPLPDQEGPHRLAEQMCFVDDSEPDAIVTGVWYESYGMPVDMPIQHDRAGIAVGRAFRGYVHRPIPYSSRGRYAYRAVELSTPVPGGASGSAIADPATHSTVFAVATETTESRVPIASGALGVDERQWALGIGVYLPPLRTWIDGVVGRPGEEGGPSPLDANHTGGSPPEIIKDTLRPSNPDS